MEPGAAFDSLVKPYLDGHGDFRSVERAGRAVEAVRIELDATKLLQTCARKTAAKWADEISHDETAEEKAQGRPFAFTTRVYTREEKFAILVGIRDHVYFELDGRGEKAMVGPMESTYCFLMDALGELNSTQLYAMRVKDWLRELIKYLLKTSANRSDRPSRGMSVREANVAARDESGAVENGDKSGDARSLDRSKRPVEMQVNVSTKDVPATGRAADLRSVAAAIRAWGDMKPKRVLDRLQASMMPPGKAEEYRRQVREVEQRREKAARRAAKLVTDKLFLLTSCANTYGCSGPSQNAIDWLKAAVAREDSVQAFVSYRDAQIKNYHPERRISMRPAQSPMHRLADETDGWAAEMEKAEHVGHGASAPPRTISQAVGGPSGGNVADAVAQTAKQEEPLADESRGGQARKTKRKRKDSAAIRLARLAKMTPAFSKNNGKWVRNKIAAELENVTTRTLATYRSQGISLKDKTLGQDKAGRVWRRPGRPHSHPWYLKSSLISQKSST